VFRHGGEEFFIVLANASADLAWTIAERIRISVEALAIVNPGARPADDSTGMMTISLGVAFAKEDAAPETVAKWADDALYDAKRSGRNVVFLSNAYASADDPHRAPAAGQAGYFDSEFEENNGLVDSPGTDSVANATSFTHLAL
jgi:predicted signal transduction protein with EAL and GGDEF domain